MKSKLTISCVKSNMADDKIRIEIKVGKDCHIAEVSLDQFTLALTGLARVPANYELFIIEGGKDNV